MNERIKELINEATYAEPYTIEGDGGKWKFDKEKFAELIIRECARVADEHYDKGFRPVGGDVLEHFGIE